MQQGNRTLLERSIDVAELQACLDQIERLTTSPLLEGSDGLCRLIRFLAEHALTSPAEHLKEYQIATEALGRPPGFDPHSDASVRVQIGRLREKLAEYYSSYGSHDPILVEIPKGKYSLSFRTRNGPETAAVSAKSIPSSPNYSPAGEFRTKRTKVVLLVAIAAAAILAGLILALLFWRSTVAARKVQEAKAMHGGPSALAIFWAPFIHSTEQPLVIFKNLGFVGDDAIEMHRFDPSRDNPDREIQSFTGIGEVMGVFELDHVFNQLGGSFRPKRDDLFTIDDARHSNLIFLGSPSRAISQSEMPGTSEFIFQRTGLNRYRWAIVDQHPKPGSSGIYPGSFGRRIITTNYAIVALKKGLDSSHWTVFLEGTSTVATQAAADYVCNEQTLGQMLNRLHLASSERLRPFEGLLRVKEANAVPIETDLLDIRQTDE